MSVERSKAFPFFLNYYKVACTLRCHYLVPQTRECKEYLFESPGGIKRPPLEDLSQLLVISEKTVLPGEYNKTKGEYGGVLDLIL